MSHQVGKEEEKSYIYHFVEDTFLLLDALEDNFEEFKTIKPSLILEVG